MRRINNGLNRNTDQLKGKNEKVVQSAKTENIFQITQCSHCRC